MEQLESETLMPEQAVLSLSSLRTLYLDYVGTDWECRGGIGGLSEQFGERLFLSGRI